MLCICYISIRSLQFFKKRRNKMERKKSQLWIRKVKGGVNSKKRQLENHSVIPMPGWAASPTKQGPSMVTTSAQNTCAAHKPLHLFTKSAGLRLHPLHPHSPWLADTYPASTTSSKSLSWGLSLSHQHPHQSGPMCPFSVLPQFPMCCVVLKSMEYDKFIDTESRTVVSRNCRRGEWEVIV